MFKKLNKYKVILIKSDGLSAKELKFKDFIIPGLFTVLCLMFFVSLLFFSKDIKEILTLKIVSKHKNNNTELNTIVQNQQNEINLLLERINEIYKKDENLRRLINLPSINEDIRKLGVGGDEKKEKFNHLKYLVPEEIDLDYMDRKIDFLYRSVNLEKISYADIEKEIELNKEYLLSYPAIYPVPNENRKFSSRFGYRRDPFSNKRKFHDGDDFSTKIGIDVYATADGVVKSSRYYGSFGNYIEIDHGNGYVTAYGHLSNRKVKKGQKISRGDIIGGVGNTGRSTAPHLHYEVRLNGKHVNPNKYYFN